MSGSRILKDSLQASKDFLRTIKSTIFGDVKRLTPPAKYITGKRALVAYLHPIMLEYKESARHTNVQEYKCLVNALLEAGYTIDLVNGCVRNDQYNVQKSYDLIFDIHNFNDWTGRHAIQADKFVLYSTGSHPSFTNAAEITRINEIFNTYGVEMQPVRFVATPHCWTGITDFAHCGERFQTDTYGKAIHSLPKHRVILSAFPSKRNVHPNVDLKMPSFVYVGGAGFIWKGVDILVRLFEKRRDWTLHIFGDSPFEPGVELLFPKLSSNGYANIHVHGSLDLNDAKILECLERSIGVLCPSFADGCNTSVINSVIRGGIPILSRECGLSDMPGVRIITDKTIEALEFQAEKLLQMNAEEINTLKMDLSHQFSERFTLEAYKKSILNILN